jgi:predicted alpha/beta-hydrolase family hydrolase
MIKIFEYEGMTVTFEFNMKHTGHGDHNVLMTEQYIAGKHGYDGSKSAMIITEQEAEARIAELIKLGYIGSN